MLSRSGFRRLRDVLMKADDLFDDVLYFDRRKQEIKGNKITKKVRTLFSSSGPLSVNWKVAREIKSIRQELDDIKSDIAGLGLRELSTLELPMNELLKNRETYSFVQTDDVIGRDDDKNQLIEMVLGDPIPDYKNVAVISIVWFGGVGKTTVAQLVFNDVKVKRHFDLTKWVCVPEVDRQVQVLRIIYSSFTNKDDYKDCSLENLQEGIRGSLNNKTFFLVMDDIWDDSRERWLPLLELLNCAKRGSKVMITTRSGVVANALGTVSLYQLGLLKPEESWNLFKRLAFREGQEESNPNFTTIGHEIVEKCHNVPLAIKAIASLLYTRGTEQEWLLIKDIPLTKTTESSILNVLKPSYDFLPSQLKQCFAYCFLFPKDYQFDKTELVCLWMAQGYIEPSNEQTVVLYALGDVYFQELSNRSFFQKTQQDDLSGTVQYKMHDLMHDLALLVAADMRDTRCSCVKDFLEVSSCPVVDRRMRTLHFGF